MYFRCLPRCAIKMWCQVRSKCDVKNIAIKIWWQKLRSKCDDKCDQNVMTRRSKCDDRNCDQNVMTKIAIKMWWRPKATDWIGTCCTILMVLMLVQSNNMMYLHPSTKFDIKPTKNNYDTSFFSILQSVIKMWWQVYLSKMLCSINFMRLVN